MLPCEKYGNEKAVMYSLQVRIYKYNDGVKHYVICEEFNVYKTFAIIITCLLTATQKSGFCELCSCGLCILHNSKLKQFIFQQMHKYIIRRYN